MVRMPAGVSALDRKLLRDLWEMKGQSLAIASVIMVARTGRPVRVTYINNLPPHHPLPVDTSIPGAEPGQPENRAVVHLHGMPHTDAESQVC